MTAFPRVILSGHAKLPQDAAARAVWEILSIVVAVDPKTATIVEADVTLVTSTAREFTRELLIGRCLEDPPDKLLALIQTYYGAGAKKALLAAAKQVYDAWSVWKTENPDART